MVTTRNMRELRTLDCDYEDLLAPLEPAGVARVVQSYDPHDAAEVSRWVRRVAALDDLVPRIEAALIDRETVAYEVLTRDDISACLELWSSNPGVGLSGADEPAPWSKRMALCHAWEPYVISIPHKIAIRLLLKFPASKIIKCC